MKKTFKENIYLIIIFIVATILSTPLLDKNLDVYYDDGIQHIARAYATYTSIINGEHTEVLSTLANGFGYSWDLFYGNFSTILIIIGKCITTTFIGGYKFTLFLGLLFSGITMYWFAKNLTNSKTIGTLTAVIYMAMPYHLNDMYIRNALGEFLSYIFIPLVFLGIYKIFQKDKGVLILSIGAIRISSNTYFNDCINSYNGCDIYMCLYDIYKR